MTMNNLGETSNNCKDGHSDVTQKTTNTGQDQIGDINSLMGESTEGNQAVIGPGD